MCGGGGGGAGAASLGLQGFGGLVQSFGAYNKAKSDKSAYDYEAQIQDNNAQIADWQAQDAVERGQIAEGRQQQKTAALSGAQRATMAARGIDLSEGSALNILVDTQYTGALDANIIKDNAAREAWGYRTEATNDRANAAVYRARRDAESPTRAFFNTLLTSGGSTAASAYTMGSKGVF